MMLSSIFEEWLTTFCVNNDNLADDTNVFNDDASGQADKYTSNLFVVSSA
jgi:hypothetical protein